MGLLRNGVGGGWTLFALREAFFIHFLSRRSFTKIKRPLTKLQGKCFKHEPTIRELAREICTAGYVELLPDCSE